MRNSIRIMFSLTLFTMYGSIVIADPTIPKEKIPNNISINVRQQIENLYSSDPVKRAYAAVHLGNMGNKAAPSIPFLRSILNDNAFLKWSNPYSLPTPGFLTAGDVRTCPGKEAAVAIWRIKRSDAFEILFDALKDKNEIIRRNVAMALSETNNKRVLNPLIAAIKDKNSGIQEVAIPALGGFEDKIATDFLIDLMHDENNNIRLYAVQGLGNSKSNHATDALILALNDQYSSVRWAAATELGERNEKRAVDALIMILSKDEESHVRDSVAGALAEIKDSRSVNPLIVALKDNSSRVRFSAAYALGQIGDNRAVNPLVDALKDKDFDVRWRSAQALGFLKATNAIKPLIDALRNAQGDKYGNVRIYSAEALKKITSKEFGNDPEKWEKWWGENKEKFKSR